MEQTELNQILDQHWSWVKTKGKQGIRANLEGANLEGANLTGANLCGAELNRADLTDANLTDANLTDANLTGADLRGADLCGANLNRADLMGANLRDANLCGAELNGADLRGADLWVANLTGANLTRADLTNAILPDVSWIIPGCLVQLNHIKYDFLLKKDNKLINFVQDNIGFFIQDNEEEKTFDMLVEDSIIRNIPDWVKYTGLRQIATESV